MVELYQFASTRYGVFTRAEAVARGVDASDLRLLVDGGVIVPEGRQVFRVTAAPVTWRQRVYVVCRRGGEDCLASHRTAAALRRFDGAKEGPIEVAIPHRSSLRIKGVRVHRTRALDDIDRDCVDNIPVTSVARTLLDLGCVAGGARLEQYLDGAMRDGLLTPEQLMARYEALRASGRNGMATARLIVRDAATTRPESALERRFVALLAKHGLPVPVLQYPVRLPDGNDVRIDAAYVARMLGYELDGHRWHSTRAQRRSDYRRLDALAHLGWDVRRFTWEQVVADGAAVVASVRTALGPFAGARVLSNGPKD